MILSVIIVSWNTCELLAQALHSLYTNADGMTLEVLVVDNASEDGSVDMVRERFPQVQLMTNSRNEGFARASNMAMRRARGKFVLLLNSDAELSAGSLSPLAAFLQSHARAGIVGPTLQNPDGSFQASYGRFPSLGSCLASLLGVARWFYGPYYPSAGPDRFLSSHPKRVDWIGGACLLVRRKAYEEVGLMDEGYFMYAEDMDWCYRMRRQGWQVYHHPGVAITHVGGASSGPVRPWVLARQWRATLHFFREHHGPIQAGVVRMCVAIIGLLRATGLYIVAEVSPAHRGFLLALARANWYLSSLNTNDPA
jgi:GT2 family glycosyltransferase